MSQSEGRYFDSMDDFLDAYTPPDRVCPQCGNKGMVSKKEAKLVFKVTVPHSYICSHCHIHE